MKITFTPQNRFDSISVNVSGDKLDVNGEVFDFSLLQEGMQVPVNNNFIFGNVFRVDGEINVTIIYPSTSNEAKDILILNANGFVEVPNE